MKISKRLDTITPKGDDGWGVFYAAMALKAKGVPLLNLTIGEHDIGTDPSILRAMYDAACDGQTGYPAIPGIDELRVAVAERTQRLTGVPTGPENVLITPGGQAALFAALMMACDPGQNTLFLDPFYVTYPGTIRGASSHPIAVQTRAEDGFQPRASDIAARIPAEGASALLLNSPNNPTGAVYTRQTLKEVAELCRDHNMWMISDEVYDSQVWSGPHLSPRALPGHAEHCIVVGSMSKSHAMTGSRLGWAIGPTEAIEAMHNLSIHTTYGVPGYIQHAALFALRQGPEAEAKVAAPFKRRRDLARKIVATQDVLTAIPADGAMYLMLDIRKTGLEAEEFCLKLLYDHHIATLPGDSFGQAARGHIRIALTLPDEQLAQALEKVMQFAASLCVEA